MRLAIPAFLALACVLPVSAEDSPASIIRVTATYPGADARTLDETVLTPIYRQINGVEGMTRIESEARERRHRHGYCLLPSEGRHEPRRGTGT